MLEGRSNDTAAWENRQKEQHFEQERMQVNCHRRSYVVARDVESLLGNDGS